MDEQVTLAVETPPERSAEIGKLAAALAKAQGAIAGAAKDRKSHHGKYADLASVWDACRSALSANELAVIQTTSAHGPAVTVTTILAHSSGEWVSGALTMTAQQNNPQGIGSCITYARRYALSSIVGVAPEDDDDGNAASQGNGNSYATTSGPAFAKAGNGGQAPAGFDDWLADLESVADEGTVKLEAAWKASQPFLRKHLTDTNKAKWEQLKAKAAKVAA